MTGVEERKMNKLTENTACCDRDALMQKLTKALQERDEAIKKAGVQENIAREWMKMYIEQVKQCANLKTVPRAKDEEAAGGMTQEREARILEAAIDTWGEDAQIGVMIEEMRELTHALLRLRWARRYEKNSQSCELCSANVREEMADVGILLNQMALIFGDPVEWEIQKLERLEERIAQTRRDFEAALSGEDNDGA